MSGPEVNAEAVEARSLKHAKAETRRISTPVAAQLDKAVHKDSENAMLSYLSRPCYAVELAQQLKRRTSAVMEELAQLVEAGSVVHLNWGRYLRSDRAEALEERAQPMQPAYPLDEAILSLLDEPRSVAELSYLVERPQKEVCQFLLGMKRSRSIVFTGPDRIERSDVSEVRNRAVAKLAGPEVTPDLKEQLRVFLETPRRMDEVVVFVSAGRKRAHRLLEQLNEAGLLSSPEFGMFRVRSRAARSAVMVAVFSQESYLTWMATPRTLRDMRRVFGFSHAEAYNHLRRDYRRKIITRAGPGLFHHVETPDAPLIKARFQRVEVEFD